MTETGSEIDRLLLNGFTIFCDVRETCAPFTSISVEIEAAQGTEQRSDFQYVGVWALYYCRQFLGTTSHTLFLILVHHIQIVVDLHHFPPTFEDEMNVLDNNLGLNAQSGECSGEHYNSDLSIVNE